MNVSSLSDQSVLLNPARLISVMVFLGCFAFSVYIWFGRRFGRWNLHFFLISLHHDRRTVLRQLFNEGPGYLILPLCLIFASMMESYLAPILGKFFN